MITLLMRPMRQLHPSLPTCRLSPEYCADVSITAAAAPISYVPQSVAMSALPLYFEYQLVISSLCASPAGHPIFPPQTATTVSAPVRNLATQSSAFCHLLSSFGMDHCKRHRVNPRPKRVSVASRLPGATRPGSAQSSYRISCFIILLFQGRVVRSVARSQSKFTRNCESVSLSSTLRATTGSCSP